jgi:hypothetical protein
MEGMRERCPVDCRLVEEEGHGVGEWRRKCEVVTEAEVNVSQLQSRMVAIEQAGLTLVVAGCCLGE